MKSYLNLDRTTKALLVVIALGLWVPLVSDFLRPVLVHAQDTDFGAMLRTLREINSDTMGIHATLSSVSDDTAAIRSSLRSIPFR